jgi:CheY-like chemotaxis protein
MKEKLNCILLVDDDEVNNFINETILKKLDVAERIVVVKNGLEALKFIAAWNDEGICPELILLDLHMPVLDGFEFMDSFKSMEFVNKDEVQIAVLTSSENPYDIEHARQLGIKNYLMKPLRAETLKPFFNSSFNINYKFSDN